MIVIALLIPLLTLAGLASGQEARPSSPPRNEPNTPIQPLPEQQYALTLELLRHECERRLVETPEDAEIMIALAVIAERQQHLLEAEQLRHKARRSNPESPLVMADMIAEGMTSGTTRHTEENLKRWIAAHPDAATLYFAHGNLLARQGRWREAEQAYFNAVVHEGDNPDFLFNLAVSLDHLRQYGQARKYYRLALEAASKRPAGFAPKDVIQRLGTLDSESPRRP